MDKGEYETALSFYAKAYGIYDGTLGLHDDTKQALMNVKLAAEKNRAAKSSMSIFVKAEEEFKRRHPSVASGGSANTHDDDTDANTAINRVKDDDKMNRSSGKRKKKKKKKAKDDAEDNYDNDKTKRPTMDII